MPFIPEWALGVGFIIIVVSIAKALRGTPSFGDRLRGRRGGRQVPADLDGKLAELDDVQRRLDDVDDLQRRVSELEERVDFTERLLAKQREGERIAPPKP
jgi:hypothetical protein